MLDFLLRVLYNKHKGVVVLVKRVEMATYGLYFMGQNIFYYLLLTFMFTYFTDMGIPVLTVSAITLIVKIWDAINDPIFGGLVDKLHLKGGKFLPWLRVSLLAIPAATIFLFAIPVGIPLWVKIIWAVVGYILWDTAYTICDVPIFGLVTTLTDVQSERTALISTGRACAMAATMAVYVVVPLVHDAIGGWLPIAILLSLAALIFMTPICFVARERVRPAVTEGEVGLKQMFKFIAKNKYILIYNLSFLFSAGLNVAQVLHMYVARHNLGDETLMPVLAALSAGPLIIAGIFIPVLAKRIDKFYLFFWASALSAALNVVSYFVGYENLWMMYGLTFLRAIPAGVVGVVMFMFTPDCAEYGQYKSGVAASGITFSIQTFAAKLTAAVATAAAGVGMSLIHFVEGDGAVQLSGFNDKLWVLYLLLPAAGTLLSLPILWRYKLRDKYVEVMVKCNTGAISREEADRQLAGKI
ncbi:sodium:galactoside symporter [Clostridia bacterium]|nr:sodium:galactoside symporter [Clostridia bacterium]